MKTKSAKQKGRRLQNQVAEALRAIYKGPGIGKNSIKPAIMGEKGRDIKLSDEAEKVIPWDFECKNTERLNLWGTIDQAKENSEAPRKWVVVFKKNGEEPNVILSFESFIGLIGKLELLLDKVAMYNVEQHEEKIKADPVNVEEIHEMRELITQYEAKVNELTRQLESGTKDKLSEEVRRFYGIK